MPSRISGACTPCRSKKQKCSGHRPSCSQCQSGSIDCTWPEQRKRGPAKGYIEGLESRLHSAESLLLAILPLVSDNTIDRASNTLRHDEESDGDGFGGRRSSPPLLNKKTGLDYWEQFPIDTRRNIRKWQFDCEANSAGNGQPSYVGRDNSSIGRRNRSPTHSPASGGMSSPRGSVTALSTQQTNWVRPMASYVSPPPPSNHMQAGAAQQLLHLRDQQRDQWMTQPPQHNHNHNHHHQDAMQLDPSLIQPRSMPQQTSHAYSGNIQQSLFW